MKICFLTQTDTDISDYYKEFFKDLDLFFITYKAPNAAPNCVGFYPNSTWSEGRNALWEAVRGKYDYYFFFDNDIELMAFDTPLAFSPLLAYAWYRLRRQSFFGTFKPATPAHFMARLRYYLGKYRPEIACLTNVFGDDTQPLAVAAMRHNSFVKRLGHFDAMTTIFSEFGASKLLPYDSKISGWWSAQIPVYLYAYHVFASKAISINELGARNMNVRANYRPGYDGVADCKKMLKALDEATGRDFTGLAGGAPTDAVDMSYGVPTIRTRIPSPADKENYAANYVASLSGLDKVLHPNVKF